MELIKEIYDGDIGEKVECTDIAYSIRKAARAIVVNEQNKIALLYVSKNNYHKLPGGGLEDSEDINIALYREVMEEVGTKIEVLDEIGVIIEYRNLFKQLQISYCYYSHTVGAAKAPSFTDFEISGGFQLKWVGFNEAIQLLEQDIPTNYVGRFIQARDLEFLKYAREKLKER